METSHSEHIQGLKAGDKKLYEAIFHTWYEPLCRYCFQRLGNQDDAEEIVQDIFVKLWLKREDLTIHLSLKSYLYRMALNKIINHHEHLKVRLNHREHVLAGNHGHNDDHAAINQKEIQSLVAMAVAGMPKNAG